MTPAPSISVVIISRDEPALDATLDAVERQTSARRAPAQIVVVDASSGRLADVRDRHPAVRWIDFAAPEGMVTIARQRNVGVDAAQGDVIVFIDAGCRPQHDWLARLLAPVEDDGELVVAGAESSSQSAVDTTDAAGRVYLSESPTLNLAVHRDAIARVGGFDERFAYGSDLDFSWRLVDAGVRIRFAPDAVVEHDWGGARREIRRGYEYGRAKHRLYRKHPGRLRTVWRTDPMTLAYPMFLLGLPLARRRKAYPLLLAVPLWRSRGRRPCTTVLHHLAFGAGLLADLVLSARRGAPRGGPPAVG
jgi:GT2 family glycosyltransferase